MKAVIALLVSSSCVVASAAVAGDSKGVLRDHLSICRQFLIHDPDPRFALDLTRDCCAYGWEVRNCDRYDWGTFER
jgi:hypothetical protein